MDPANTLFQIEQHGLNENSFTDGQHRFAFKVAREMVNKGSTTLDENALASALEDRQMEGALEYCREVFRYGQNLDSVPLYAKLISEAHMRREIKQIGARLMDNSDNPEATIEQIKAVAENQLLSIAQERKESTWKDAAVIRSEMWKEARTMTINGGSGTIGVPFTSDQLNRLLGGARKGRLTVVVAPEKGGKTIWWGGEAVGQAKDGIIVGGWCGEMTQDEIIGRAAARDAEVSSFTLDAGYSTEYQLNQVQANLESLGGLPIKISDDPMDIDTLCSWVRRAIAKDGIQIMYVDHLDLIDGRGSDYERVSNNVKRLRELALQTDLPIVAMHQLSRKYEHESRSPGTRDLRDSGKVSHNAYSVSVFYQDKYDEPCDESKIIWKVCLNRGGPTGLCLFNRNFDIQEMTECTKMEKEQWRKMKGLDSGASE